MGNKHCEKALQLQMWTFILKVLTGTHVCCFRPLDAGVKKKRKEKKEITQASGRKTSWKHRGAKLPLVADGTGPAVCGSGRGRTAASRPGLE